jgi:co-chaperonin GroES (HSP10)
MTATAFPIDRIRPMPGKILVSKPNPLAQRKKTAGGIELADISDRFLKEAGQICIVRKVGREVTLVKPGDIVWVMEFSGTPLVDTSKQEIDVWFIGEGDVIAVLDSPDAVQVD